MIKRSSGILLHVTSLPSPYGIGDMGPETYQFIDQLAEFKQHYWSILPLTPTNLVFDSSPYQPSSAFAGNTLLISPDKLMADDLLPKTYSYPKNQSNPTMVDFPTVYQQKQAMLKASYEHFQQTNMGKNAYEKFCQESSEWLEDYALFAALKEHSNKPWYEWPTALRDREKAALENKKQILKLQIDQIKFVQYLFFSQWRLLKEYCKQKQVTIVGDMPFYMAYDSADMWLHPEHFKLDQNKKPKFVGGVPPDYFSDTGQLWGNPVYDWDQMLQTKFDWWIKRVGHSLKIYDILRLDHFRGFVAYWQIPANDGTAKNGHWFAGQPEVFFETVKQAFPALPFIAEDLGDIDDEVKAYMAKLGVPGMRVLLFGFNGADDNPNVLKFHTENTVAYTGTHDTNTVKGWFEFEATEKEKKNLFELVGRKVGVEEVSLEVTKLALSSKANLCLTPIQDVLGLGPKARMNTPNVQDHNWAWRITREQLTNPALKRLIELSVDSKRSS